MNVKTQAQRYLAEATVYFARQAIQVIDRRLLITSGIIATSVQLPFFLMTLLGISDKMEDFAYGLSFIAIALGTLFLKGTHYLRQIVVTMLTVIWGLRISLFLLYRRYHMKDFWLEPLKKNVRGIISFWIFQTMAVWMTALPLTMLNSFSHNPMTGVRDMLGYAMWMIGFIIECVADYQKFQFKQQHKDRFCNVGLYKFSRHPNYFGELLIWWGVMMMASPTMVGWTWISVLGPLFHTFMILFVTGIPPLEHKNNNQFQNNPAYQRYKANTPILIPAISRSFAREKLKKIE